MKYSVETTDSGVIETLEVEGSLYKKEWTREENGLVSCKQKDFSTQMQNDGYEDDELLEKIEEVFDSFIASSVDDMRDYLSAH